MVDTHTDDESKYLGLCPHCGSSEWMELAEDNDDNTPRMNYSMPNGDIKYNNVFKKQKYKRYLDNVCASCEAPCLLIPFKELSQAERINIYKMTNKERIKFVHKWAILQNLELKGGNEKQNED